LTSISQPPKEEEEENTPSNPSNPFYYFHNPATTKLSNNIPSIFSKHKEKITESNKNPPLKQNENTVSNSRIQNNAYPLQSTA
jgi:hypothetical protein